MLGLDVALPLRETYDSISCTRLLLPGGGRGNEDSIMVLSGIRGIDLGRFIAGPMCAAMLADLGADVIRVERIEGGDDRFQYLTGPRGDNGACFLQWNRNKRSQIGR